mgnify:FL=1
MKRSLIAAIIIAAVSAACERDPFTAPTDTATAIDVNAFASQVVPGGSASREFTLTTSGKVGVTLKTTTPAGAVLGLGMGIPRSNGTCALADAVQTTAGSSAQLSMSVDTGTFCVKVYDTGTLSAPVAFTLGISRP